MKMTLILLGLGLGIVGLVVVIGYMLPVSHLASRTIKLRVPADRVWTAISDFKGSVGWRDDLKSVEQVEHRPGVFAWKEIGKNGDSLTYLILEATPETKLVRKVADEGIPFGGTWTFEMNGENEGTLLTVTENGEVYNPIFRFVSRFVFGHYASIDKYFAQLKRHFGEE
jgi:hypothetical protein